MRRLALGLIAAAVLAPAAACAAPKAIEDETRARVVAAATEGMPPEEANDPETVPAWMKTITPKMFKKIDIDGDALPDWLVDYERAPNPSFFCGSGGCRRMLYVGRKDGSFEKVYDHVGGPLKFSGPKSARRLEVNFHGSVCGSYGADECLRAYRWDTAQDRYVEVPNSKRLAMLVGGSAPAIYKTVDQAPAEVKADLKVRDDLCKTTGGRYPSDEAAFTDVIDLNGDGVRDWVVGSSYDACTYEDERPEKTPDFRLLVLTSRPDGTFAKAYESASAAWNLDIATAPATLVIVHTSDACGFADKPCPTTRLTWDPAGGTLKP